MTELTVVMYHYVRPLESERFRINGLDVHLFEEQIAYIAKNYNVVSCADVLAAIDSGRPLPERAALLTFDDGYKDHYSYAFPVLRDQGLTGAFFLPSAPIVEHRVLDVNKIHFILGAGEAPDRLADAIDREIEKMDGAWGLRSVDDYRAEYLVPNRFDGPEANYVKRMLQRVLPAEVRSEIADRLFNTTVTSDSSGFAQELYLNIEECREMVDGGMEIGLHTHNHPWLGSIPVAEQRQEIERSLSLLDLLGLPRADFLFAYPYGDYSQSTCDVLSSLKCALAFTTKVSTVDLHRDTRFELPRLDTNDLPKSASAAAPF